LQRAYLTFAGKDPTVIRTRLEIRRGENVLRISCENSRW
jgi:hypothetical protein